MAAGAATEVATLADSTDPASTEEALSSYVAFSQTDVDPFDNGYLLQWLIDSVWLMDDNMQQMIASV
jgi:hypothetical protein